MSESYEEKLKQVRRQREQLRENIDNREKEIKDIKLEIEKAKDELDTYLELEKYLSVLIQKTQCSICKKEIPNGVILSYGTFCNKCYAKMLKNRK